MPPTIRLSQETYEELDRLGNTSDSFDDVIKRELSLEVNDGGVTTSGNGTLDDEINSNRYTVGIADETSYEEFDNRNQCCAMQMAVEYLVQEHDLAEVADLPIMTNGNQSILAEEKVHPDGKKMRNPHEIIGEYHLETSAGKGAKQRWLRSLADKCDVDVRFGPEWG